MREPEFTLGIEEEYLLVDRDSLELASVPADMFAACKTKLGDQVAHEFMACQIEVGTGVCADIAAARTDLTHLRRCISDEAAKHNLAPISSACHPFGDWAQQNHTDMDRYNQLYRDLGSVAGRMLISGMHVHVGIGDDHLRADLINQLSYFLPHLLALSVSSPFWQGRDTGLASYRIAVFDNMPRTGLPPQIDGWSSYTRAVRALVELDVIEDSSKIWWDLRPSHRFPTLETRICDAQPRLEHALSLAALNQCLLRMLYRLRQTNQRWRLYDNFLLSENRWRAQRYGVTGGLIDFGRHEIVPMAVLVEELIALVADDAVVLSASAEVAALRDILSGGSSADRQRAVMAAHPDDPAAGARAVVSHLIEEFHADL